MNAHPHQGQWTIAWKNPFISPGPSAGSSCLSTVPICKEVSHQINAFDQIVVVGSSALANIGNKGHRVFMPIAPHRSTAVLRCSPVLGRPVREGA